MVLGVSMPSVSDQPPNIGLRCTGPPLAFSPWQTAHLSANTLAPCTALPLPGGRPAPLGIAVMSQAAMSCSVIGLPSLGVSAHAAAETASAIAVGSSMLRVDMFDAPAAVDAPAGEAVVVLV